MVQYKLQNATQRPPSDFRRKSTNSTNVRGNAGIGDGLRKYFAQRELQWLMQCVDIVHQLV